jgi:hypothetical protein
VRECPGKLQKENVKVGVREKRQRWAVQGERLEEGGKWIKVAWDPRHSVGAEAAERSRERERRSTVNIYG